MWLQKSSSVLLRFMCGTQDGVAPGPSAVPFGEQPSQGPHASSSQPAVGRARQQTHCVTCESSHGRVAGRGCHPAEASAPELDHLDAASDPSPRSWGRRQNVSDRQIPAQVPRVDHTASDTPAGRTQLSPWPGTRGTGSHGLEASTWHTQVCPMCTGARSPAGSARRS